MTPEELSALKVRIEEKLLELDSHIKSLRDTTRPVEPDNAIGRLTRMDAINAKGVSEASLRSAEEESARLKVALKRIDTDGYGVCAECGEDIPLKRLMVMPASTLCVNCAEGR